MRKKAREDAEQAQALLAAKGPSAAAARSNEPHVGTSPFQAARLMRAFDVLLEKDAQVIFWGKLNVDMKRESVRGTCHLPNGLKTQVRVLAFCEEWEVEETIAAGADFAGITDIVRRINQGWLGFDRCIATPAIMPQVMKVAKVLGPRKMMPNPKSGTVVSNLKQAIKEAKGGTLLEYRAEGEGDLKVVIADASFTDAKILENMKFLIQTLLRARPRSGSTASGGPPKPGSAAAKAPGPSKPLIPGKVPEKSDGPESFFIEAAIQMGKRGPPIVLDTESMMPASVGYFR